jgi:transposase
LGHVSQAPAETDTRQGRHTGQQTDDGGGVQEPPQALPHDPDPGREAAATPTPAQAGSRGRIAKSDAHNLWERFKQHEDAVLLFAKVPHVPFTNNRAERDLRMSKVKQKVSGCFRKREEYAEAYCRISSYLQTMANRGYNPLVAIQMALSGQLSAQGGE